MVIAGGGGCGIVGEYARSVIEGRVARGVRDVVMSRWTRRRLATSGPRQSKGSAGSKPSKPDWTTRDTLPPQVLGPHDSPHRIVVSLFASFVGLLPAAGNHMFGSLLAAA
ncbi:hypothetical protein ANO11243_072660 [Dothideomycetidae sp. 11243]|nr:hypothetical protein ANO11243_072660 [fungal sp. No.11243]